MFQLTHGSELPPLIEAELTALLGQIRGFLGVSFEEDGSLSAQVTTTTGGSGDVPAGVTVPFAGATTPAGWLLCNGDAVSRSTYADLFGVIGTTWGVGDGATTFNIPNLVNYGVMGAGANVALGARTGTWNHTHVGAAHLHGIDPDTGLLTGAPSATTVVQSGVGATVASATHTHTTGAHAHGAFTVAGGAANTSAANPPVAGLNYLIRTGL